MPLLSSSKKAEQFAKLLDGSASTGSGDLATLQGLASRLSSVPQPRAEFASALRDRLMSEAATTLPGAAGGAAGTGTGTGAGGTGGAGSAATSAASTTSSAVAGTTAGGSAVSSVLSVTAPLWTQLAAGAAAAAIAITSVGVGASRSLPGDLFYGVKRQVETIQLDLAGGSTDKALTQLDFARTRLSELADLLEGRPPGAPLSADLQKKVSDLLTAWAGDTSGGTTVLLDQLGAGQGDVAAVRAQLISFIDSQARSLAVTVQGLPDPTLESLTGSAFAYLQRVDTALGNPVNLAALLPSLGLALPAATGTVPSSTPSTKAPSTTAPSSAPGSSASTPSGVPTLPIPTSGHPVPHSTTNVPTVPSVPLPSGGTGSLPKGGAVTGATSGATKTVDGVLQGVTGNGPSLPLPTAVPTVPTLPKLGK